MKWFKHFTDMRHDPKIKRLVRKYGVAGYGLYTYIVECIATNLESKSPIPDLEETADDIAHDLKMESKLVEEIVSYCLEQELFTVNSITNRIVCGKIYKFLDDTTRKNPDIVKMIAEFKKLGQTRTNSERLGQTPNDSDKVQTEEEKKKKRKEEEKKIIKKIPPELKFVKEYCEERKNGIDPQSFIDHYEANGWMRGKNKIKCWKACIRTWEKNNNNQGPKPTAPQGRAYEEFKP